MSVARAGLGSLGVAAVHTALLTAPILLAGRGQALVDPRAITCVVLLVVLSLVEPIALRSSRAGHAASMRGSPMALASGVGLLLTAWLSLGGSSRAWWCWLGVLPVLAGVALRVLAIRDLGPSFSSTIEPPPGGKLVVRGIYGRVRHPSDLGLLLIAAGVAALGGSLTASLVALGVVLPSIAVRLGQEERSLSAQFGSAHQDYRDRVSALFPI